MLEFVRVHLELLVSIMVVVGLVSWLTALVVWVRQGLLKRRFRKWKDIHSTADLDAVYERTLRQVESLRAEVEDLQRSLAEVRSQLRKKVSTARVKRYNAFSDMGSDLSFSVALLDDDLNGVVLSSIYGREESRTYAKPIQNGASRYTLTEEEVEVIGDERARTAAKQPAKV